MPWIEPVPIAPMIASPPREIDPAVAVATGQVEVGDPGEAAFFRAGVAVLHLSASSLGATMWVMNQFMRVSMKPNWLL